MKLIEKGIQEIKREYRAACRKEDKALYEKRLAMIQEDIELYISLHKVVDDDLLQHCDIMVKGIWAMYKLGK